MATSANLCLISHVLQLSALILLYLGLKSNLSVAMLYVGQNTFDLLALIKLAIGIAFHSCVKTGNPTSAF